MKTTTFCRFYCLNCNEYIEYYKDTCGKKINCTKCNKFAHRKLSIPISIQSDEAIKESHQRSEKLKTLGLFGGNQTFFY